MIIILSDYNRALVELVKFFFFFGTSVNSYSIKPAIPLSTNAWKGKKVVIVSVPGAFTVRAISNNEIFKIFSDLVSFFCWCDDLANMPREPLASLHSEI